MIDPRTTWPLDKETLINSAKKTSRALVVDEGYERYGVTAEIAAVIADGDVVLTMGAGSISAVAHELPGRLGVTSARAGR